MENKFDTNDMVTMGNLMRKRRMSGLKGHHKLEEFTIVEWK